MNWLTKYYSMGAEVAAPHLQKEETPREKSTVTGHYLAPFSQRIAGITVQFEDGIYMDIDVGYLEPDGSGV